MNRKRYFAAVAENAVSAGRPLHAALEDAAKDLRKDIAAPAREMAREGQLAASLDTLGVDPMVVAAAIVAPGATSEVSTRIRALPRASELLTPVVMPVIYVGLVLLFQATAAVILDWKVVPVLEGVTGSRIAVDVVPPLVFLVMLGAAVAVLVLQAKWIDRGGVLGRVLEPVRAARLFCGAAVLARHGVEPPRAVEMLGGTTKLSGERCAEILGDRATLDAAALENVAEWLSGEAGRRANRLAQWARTVGGITAVAIGLLLVLMVYLQLSRIVETAY